MASNSFTAKTQDQVCLPIDSEDELMKPINVNWTNPNLKNPFVLEHNTRLGKIRVEVVDDIHAVTNL
jgi:hypothetical protein